jgi:hypothetical protein
MSALASLIGIGCADCKRKGHFCQAQMWEHCEETENGVALKFRKPLCLRCADGEPCYQETCVEIVTPERLVDEVDLCLVPKPTAQDLEHVAKLGRPRSVRGDNQHSPDYAARRAAMLQDLQTMTVGDVAKKYQVSRSCASHIRDKENARKRKLALLEKLRTPVEREIGGEMVRIAPLSQMGAELLDEVAKLEGNAPLARILKAVREGCRTSTEVAAASGVPMNSCTAYMSKLYRRGHLRIIGKQKARTGGVLANLYEIVECEGAAV